MQRKSKIHTGHLKTYRFQKLYSPGGAEQNAQHLLKAGHAAAPCAGGGDGAAGSCCSLVWGRAAGCSKALLFLLSNKTSTEQVILQAPELQWIGPNPFEVVLGFQWFFSRCSVRSAGVTAVRAVWAASLSSGLSVCFCCSPVPVCIGHSHSSLQRPAGHFVI